MKKLAIIAILATAAVAASATDLGLRVGRVAGAETSVVGVATEGVTLGQKFGTFGAEVAYDRALVGASSLSRYSLVGTYDVAKVAVATVTAKAGGVFIDPTVGANGYAALVGVGASYPLTKNVSLVADYAYQVGQDRVKLFNGNVVSIGTKYSF